jgi:hypothetical protein
MSRGYTVREEGGMRDAVRAACDEGLKPQEDAVTKTKRDTKSGQEDVMIDTVESRGQV